MNFYKNYSPVILEFNPLDEVDLNITEGELNIHPAIPTSELSWAATNDLPYVLSVEIIPYTFGWPRRTLYFLSPTYSDKQKWVAGLEQISEGVKKATQKNGHVSASFHYTVIILQWSKKYFYLCDFCSQNLGELFL